ncbi:MAG TPA: beta-propeller domain-containing protein [Burkholderiaceae bacterium]|nr:beta-propeller domain-containing protein [Burkholderiaceae bacterium]
MSTRRQLLTRTLSAWTVYGLSGPLCPATANPFAPGNALTPFRDESEYLQALQRWRSASLQSPALRRREHVSSSAPVAAMAASPAPAVAADSRAAESITNVQTAGVDEGGIVKQAGEHLVILRRGRLFTVRVGGNALEPVAAVDAYAPGIDPQGAWYDELLIAGPTVVVVGYSYARGGTEIGLFSLGRDGSLRHQATHHLHSFDYYSSRNYASRLVGRKLIFYSPSYLQPWDPQPWENRPGLRRWQGATTPAEFRRILPATRIYRTDDDYTPGEPLALHTVTQIDLDNADLRAESTAVLGPAGRVFYVSQGAVYVWTSSRRRAGPGSRDPASLSAVFRLPLDGGAPRALKTAGVPIDQMSFLEDAGGYLNVLLRESGRGEATWGAERTDGGMALLRVPLSEFGDGHAAARPEHYRRVPSPAGADVQNRFVGDWLLWGSATQETGLGDEPGATGWAVQFSGSDEPQTLRPGHAVERIEALGRDAVLVGRHGTDLCLSSVELRRRAVRIVDRHVQPWAAQGETRSHGFFYRAQDGDTGLLGLPVQDQAGGRRQASAAVMYLRQRGLHFIPLGQLQARAEPPRGDACKASCVDWYGNARPIFLGERVFALLGYELVEGRVEAVAEADERIRETRRVEFVRRLVPGGRAWPFD